MEIRPVVDRLNNPYYRLVGGLAILGGDFAAAWMTGDNGRPSNLEFGLEAGVAVTGALIFFDALGRISDNLDARDMQRTNRRISK